MQMPVFGLKDAHFFARLGERLLPALRIGSTELAFSQWQFRTVVPLLGCFPCPSIQLLGPLCTKSTIKLQVAQWDAIEKEEEIQESKEDDAAGHDDELDSEGRPFEVGGEESKEETDEGEGTNEEEGIIEDGVDTGTLQLQEEKAIKEKEEDESDVEVIFP